MIEPGFNGYAAKDDLKKVLVEHLMTKSLKREDEVMKASIIIPSIMLRNGFTII